MPHHETRSSQSRPRRPRQFKAGKRIARKGSYYRGQHYRNRVARKHKQVYSPEYQQKPVDRLCYSEEHKPKVDIQEETQENYDCFVSKEIAMRLKQQSDQSDDIIQKISQINL